MGTCVSLRDATERALRAWNRHEVERGAPPVVDFDYHPQDEAVSATTRLATRAELVRLRAAAADTDEHLFERLTAALTYLDALLGVRLPIRDYIASTQGCDANGWTDEHLALIRDVAIEHLADQGIGWGSSTLDDLKNSEQQIESADVADTIRSCAEHYEKAVREFVASDAPFSLTIEHVDVDEYWGYWLDGAGQNVRMRINARRANFTDVLARQFALHEILGHGLQCASFAHHCADADVPWVRLTSVHAQQQVLLEGLAQALPLHICPDDQAVITRVRLAHYVELVRARLHLAVNDGVGIDDCIAIAADLAPFWSPQAVGDALADRSVNPLLRSYLWSYPAGIDWFVSLADGGTAHDRTDVYQAAYREPLTPQQLSKLWPNGPAFGGDTR